VKEHDEAHARFNKACGGMMDNANPPVSEKQRRFMGAELARKRAGKKTQTTMSEEQLSDFAGKVRR